MWKLIGTEVAVLDDPLVRQNGREALEPAMPPNSHILSLAPSSGLSPCGNQSRSEEASSCHAIPDTPKESMCRDARGNQVEGVEAVAETGSGLREVENSNEK